MQALSWLDCRSWPSVQAWGPLRFGGSRRLSGSLSADPWPQALALAVPPHRLPVRLLRLQPARTLTLAVIRASS